MKNKTNLHRFGLAGLSLVSIKPAAFAQTGNCFNKDAQRNGFQGIGKPEPLKGDLSNCWSRRINSEHRLVYRIEKDALLIISYRYHYKK